VNSPDRHDHAAAPSWTATRSRGSEAARIRWPLTRRRFAATAVVVATTLGMAVAQMSTSVAQASPGDGPTDFSSSFETGQPQPTWTSTLEADSKGVTKAWGVTMTTTVGSGPSNGYNIRPQVRLDGRRVPALRRPPEHGAGGLGLRQALRRRHPRHVDDRAVLHGVSGGYVRRQQRPQHLRGGGPGVHRRHLPFRPRSRRPARQDAEPARAGGLERPLRRPVEPRGVRHRRRGRRQDHRPHPRRLRQAHRAADFSGWLDDNRGHRRARPQHLDAPVPITSSRPGAPTPAAASREATTSRRPRYRMASTSGPRRRMPGQTSGSTSTSGRTMPRTCRRSKRSRSATSPVPGWATGRRSRSCRRAMRERLPPTGRRAHWRSTTPTRSPSRTTTASSSRTA